MIRIITSGESHGPSLTAIVEGLPAGIAIDIRRIESDLHRRQHGYGRGDRMKIERDHAIITSGVRHGYSLGSPITLQIENRDWLNWQQEMSSEPVKGFVSGKSVFYPRPGHADLPGHQKYGHTDLRNILERASARETTARVAAGGLLKCLLESFSIRLVSHTTRIGEVEAAPSAFTDRDYQRILRMDESPLRCLDDVAEKRMMQCIDQAQTKGDTLGGVFEVIAFHVPPGLGTHTQWDRRLDGRIAQAFMSIPSVKAVEIGEGVLASSSPGSEAHDPIRYSPKKRSYYRTTNHAGGLEGGITNGMPLQVRGYLKPISSLRNPLASVDIRTKKRHKATYQRSDVCVVPAAGVIGESMLAFILADALLEKFGGDSLLETQRNFQNYLSGMKEL